MRQTLYELLLHKFNNIYLRDREKAKNKCSVSTG